MINHRTVKQTRFAGSLLALALAATPAFAVNKDMVQLQTEVQDLQAAVAHMQQSNDERMGVLRDLVQNAADSVNKMSVAVQTLQQKLTAQQEAAGGKIDQVSGQVQSLNDSLDEVKARLNAMDKALQSVQSQQQSINAALQNMATNPANAAPGTAPGTNAAAGPGGTAPAGSNLPPTSPSGAPNAADNSGVPFPTTQGPYANATPAPTAPAATAPPVADLYGAALGDFMAAKNSLATNEFNQVIQSYPDDSLAGNAYFYLGEIDYHAGKFAAAIKNYDHVVDQYPSNPKVAASHLHKGSALLALKQRDAGIAELRALIQRFPTSPEAAQARTKLNGMGVPVAARRP